MHLFSSSSPYVKRLEKLRGGGRRWQMNQFNSISGLPPTTPLIQSNFRNVSFTYHVIVNSTSCFRSNWLFWICAEVKFLYSSDIWSETKIEVWSGTFMWHLKSTILHRAERTFCTFIHTQCDNLWTKLNLCISLD